MFNKRKPYPSDLTDREWEVLKPLLPPLKERGRKRTVDLREIVNAIFYVLRTRCQWDYLPHDFPPTDTVYWVLSPLAGRWYLGAFEYGTAGKSAGAGGQRPHAECRDY